MQTLIVCAAVIWRGDQILIAQRKPYGDQGLLWEFPGGKLVPGESPAQCLEREIKEELDMQIGVREVLEVVSHCYRVDTQILLLAYTCYHIRGEGRAVDCQDFTWIAPEQLYKYPMAEADIPVRDKLLNLMLNQ